MATGKLTGEKRDMIEAMAHQYAHSEDHWLEIERAGESRDAAISAAADGFLPWLQRYCGPAHPFLAFYTWLTAQPDFDAEAFTDELEVSLGEAVVRVMSGCDGTGCGVYDAEHDDDRERT